MPGKPPSRIIVVGVSGSGKSTLSSNIRDKGYPRLELDSVQWQPNWQMQEKSIFRSQVEDFVLTHDRWVVDGNYLSSIQDIVWSRADMVVWLDLPRWRVMQQVIWRSFRRVALRKELWNGNRENLKTLLCSDPEENIILWAWTRHGPYRKQFQALMEEPKWSDLEWVRLTSHQALKDWSDRLPGSGDSV